jgi:alpha-L-rhamnosidase
VSTAEQTLDKADLWDSDWVQSAATTQVLYEGKPMPPVTRVYWRVRIRDDRGRISDWSKPTWYETGLCSEAQWQQARWISSTRDRTPETAPKELMGPWIGPGAPEAWKQSEPLVYGLDFDLPSKPVVSAGAWWDSAEATGIECKINDDGSRDSFRKNARGYTDFAFCLHPGKNGLRFKMPQPPADPVFTFGMRIVFADGTEQIVRSGSEWMIVSEDAETSAVRVDCPYGAQPRGQAIVHPLAPLPAAWYKTDFFIDKTIASARLYCCGLGYNTPYLNGEKVGDHVLDPGQTDYEQVALYQAFDVTGQLRQGRNAWAVLLGDGWYNQDRGFNIAGLRYGDPVLIGLLRICYEDGTVDHMVTDEKWQWRQSATQMSNVYFGDHVDFQLDHDEWKQPGFSDLWQPVKTVKAPTSRLEAQAFAPIRKIRTIEPVTKWQTGSKTWVFDLGQNISGWVRLKFNEPEGAVIRIRCTETADADGRQLRNVPKSFWW